MHKAINTRKQESVGPAYKPPTTPHLSHMCIAEGAVQETLSKAQELRVSEEESAKLGSLSEERDGWYVVKTTVHNIFPEETLFLSP